MTHSTIQKALAFSWRYVRLRPVTLSLIAVSSMLKLGCDIIMPRVSGWLMDSLTVGPSTPEARHTALLAVLSFLALGVIYAIFQTVGVRALCHQTSRCMTEIIKQTFAKVLRFNSDWHANTFAGSTVRKMTRGMWALDMLSDTLFFGFIPAIIVVTGVTILLLQQWFLMGLVVGGFSLIHLTASILTTTRYISPANRDANAMDTKMGAQLADSVTCHAVVTGFGREKHEDNRLATLVQEWHRVTVKSWLRMTNASALSSTLSILMQAGVLSLSLWEWGRGAVTPGDVMMALSSYFMVNFYIREIGGHLRHLQRASNDMEDLIQFHTQPAAKTNDTAMAQPLTITGGEIVFDRVTFCYEGKTKPLYNDFSLAIRPGERVALVGHSGSGKSTFVKLLQRIYAIEKGDILIDGQNIKDVTQESLRQTIAVVPQEPILFHRSLAENIAYGRPDATMDEIVNAACQAHADDFIRRCPDGYNTLVGERGIKLSGGERQRVAIARAILADAPILILDEATSSLDSLSEALIQDALETLMRGRTSLVIAHRLSTVQRVDRILVFNKGEIVEQGTHSALIARPDGAYRQLYEMQTLGLIGQQAA